MNELKYGSKGGKVEELQTALNKAKAKPPLKIDGLFGKLTFAALKKFQSQMKLDQSGIADAATLYALKLGSKPKTEDKAPQELIDKIKDNIKGLETLVSESKDVRTQLVAIEKFIHSSEGYFAQRQKDNISVLASLRSFLQELASLRAEYDKIKTTHLARAAAILHRIKEIEKEKDSIVSGYNKGNLPQKDLDRLSGMMIAFKK